MNYLEKTYESRQREKSEKEETTVLSYLRSIRSFFAQKQQLISLVGYIVLIGNIYFGYGLTLLIPQEMGLKNIYLNGTLIGFADIMGYAFLAFTIKYFSRKFFHYFHVLGIIICCSFLFLVGILFDRSSFSVKLFETLISSNHIFFKATSLYRLNVL